MTFMSRIMGITICSGRDYLMRSSSIFILFSNQYPIVKITNY